MTERDGQPTRSQVVAVLFSDVVASTSLFTELGDAAAHEVMANHDRLAREVLDPHLGRRVKGLGDGVLAVFPSPRAALRAAVELQARTAQAVGAPAIRVGITAGETLEDEDGDVHGATVAACARVTALAQAGQILASETVIHLAGATPGVVAQRLGGFELKGFDQPVVLWMVSSPGAPSQATVPTPARTTDDFIGREHERLQLSTTVESAASGFGELVLISGEAGMGKTRLAREVLRGAPSDELETVWAACWEGDDPPPYWPWTQVVRSLVALLGRRGEADDMERSVLDLLNNTAAIEVSEPNEGIAARARLFTGVVDVLDHAARPKPVLIVLDDLHRADDPSLLLLRHVAAHVPTMPVVIVGTYRTDDIGDARPLGARVPEYVRWSRLVPLSGLHDDEVGGLVAVLTGTRPEASLVASMIERTRGNPLLVRELAYLDARGDVEGAHGARAMRGGVNAILAGRLARVSVGCRTTLDAAAVLGTSFAVEVLGDVVGETVDVVAAIDEAVLTRILETGSAGRYRFSHVLFRDTLASELLEAVRIGLHRRCGEALERHREQGRPVEPRELAHHFAAASALGEWDRAARYSAESGDRAMAALGYEDAVAHYEAALRFLEHVGGADRRRGDVLIGLATAVATLGDPEGARARARDAVDLARSTASGALLARAALCLSAHPAGFEVAMADDEQVDVLHQACDLLPPQPSALRSLVLARLSVALSFSESLDTRRLLANDAIEIARACGDASALASALAAYCDTIAGPAHVLERLALSREIASLAATTRDDHRLLLALRLQVVALLESGNVLGADASMAAYATAAARIRQPLYDWLVPVWRGMQAFLAGDLAATRRTIDDAATIAARAGSTNAGVMCSVQRWLLEIVESRGDEALATFGAMVGDLQQLGEPLRIPLALTLAGAGDMAGATAQLGAISVDVLEAVPLDSEWLPFFAELTDAIDLVGGHPLADWTYNALLPHRDLFAVEGIGAVVLGSIEHYLGVLAGHLGRPAEALAHFDAAAAAHRRIRAPLLVLRDHAARTRVGAATTTANVSGDRSSVKARLVRAGDQWTIEFGQRRASVKDSKGLRDLAQLIARAGHEVHVLDLASPSGTRTPFGDGGEVLDSRARDAYGARLRAIEADIEEAQRFGDVARAETAQIERDALVDQLAAAYGLRGRARRAVGDAERARSAVTRRIHDALRRLEAAHPEFALHLRRAVKTGTYCIYEPDQPVDWEVGAS